MKEVGRLEPGHVERWTDGRGLQMTNISGTRLHGTFRVLPPAEAFNADAQLSLPDCPLSLQNLQGRPFIRRGNPAGVSPDWYVNMSPSPASVCHPGSNPATVIVYTLHAPPKANDVRANAIAGENKHVATATPCL